MPEDFFDYQEVERLVRHYSDSVTRGDWDQFEKVFAADTVVDLTPIPPLGSSTTTHLVGLPSICEFFHQALDGMELFIQIASSVVVRPLGSERAKMTSTIHEMGRNASINFELYGIYYDDAAVIDGEWKFTHRLFQPVYVLPGAMSGQVVGTRASFAASR